MAQKRLRWSGPGRIATLDLSLAATDDLRLRFSVVMAITEEVLASLVVRVNDVAIEVAPVEAEEGVRIHEGRVPAHALKTSPNFTRISFEVGQTVSPKDLGRGNDERRLGIALSWVEINPVMLREEKGAADYDRLRKVTSDVRFEESDV